MMKQASPLTPSIVRDEHLTDALCRPGVLKVVDIDPQGSIETSKGLMNSQEVERGR